MSVMRTKTVEQSIADTEDPAHQLPRLSFAIWMVVGLVVYFSYSMRKSRLAGPRTATDRAEVRPARNGPAR